MEQMSSRAIKLALATRVAVDYSVCRRLPHKGRVTGICKIGRSEVRFDAR
jgi:hypothetical protein